MHARHDLRTLAQTAGKYLLSLLTPTKLVIVGTIAASVILGFIFSDSLQALRAPIHAHPFWGIGLFTGILIAVTVFPVVSSLPLLPIAGAVWGLAMGSVYAALGWWIGGLVAFMIARRFGRPVLERYISFRKLDSWEEQIPADIGFRGMVFARILLPPSVCSYTVGMMRHISFTRFALASLLGGIPISFFLVALGSAVAAGSPAIFVLYSLFIVALLVAAYFGLWRRWKKER